MRIAFSFLMFVFSTSSLAQDGTIDTSFGENGFRHFDLENVYDELTCVNDICYMINAPYVVKLDEFGYEITDFGDNGWLIPTTADNQAIQIKDGHAFSSENLLLGGNYLDEDGRYALSIIKLWSNGSKIESFGNYGVASAKHPTYEHMDCNALFKCNDGGILACGMAWNGSYSTTNSQRKSIIVRFLENGELDTSFGQEGIVTGGSKEYYQGIVQLQDRIAVIGTYAYFTEDMFGDIMGDVDFIFFWLLEDGSYDSDIQNINVEISQTYSEDESFNRLEIYDETSILVGIYDHDNAEGKLVKYLYEGLPDETFAEGGTISIPETPETNPNMEDIAVQEDGKILLALRSESDMVLTRYDVSGEIDLSFGTLGTFTYSDSLGYRAREISEGVNNSVLCLSRRFEIDTTASYYPQGKVTVSKLNSSFYVGIFEIGESESVYIFPNPATNEFRIRMDRVPYDISSLQLVNLSGELVKSWYNPDLRTSISLDGISPGVYIFKVTSDQGIFTEKLIIAR